MRSALLCMLLAGCAIDSSQYDIGGYKLPGDCNTAEQLAGDVPVKLVDPWTLARKAGRRVYGMAQYRLGPDGKPIKATATIFIADNLTPGDKSYASILCHERWHVVLGAWHS